MLVEVNRQRLEELFRDMEEMYDSINFVDEVSQTQESKVESDREHFYIGRSDVLDRETLNGYSSGFNLASDLVESQRKLERKFLLKELEAKAAKGEIPTFRLEEVDREVIAHAIGSVVEPKKVFTPEAEEVVEVLERETGFNKLEELPENSEVEHVVVTGEDVYTGFKRYQDTDLPFDASDYNKEDDRLVTHLEEIENGFKLYRGSVISKPSADASAAAVIDISDI